MNKADLKRLKAALQEKAGLDGDLFITSLAFSTRKQKIDELKILLVTLPNCSSKPISKSVHHLQSFSDDS